LHGLLFGQADEKPHVARPIKAQLTVIGLVYDLAASCPVDGPQGLYLRSTSLAKSTRVVARRNAVVSSRCVMEISP
jgi:hypothetical protein